MSTQPAGFPPQEMYALYSQGREAALEAQWRAGARSPMLAAMLSAWHLRRGDAKAASACLPLVPCEEERALKYQTLRLLPTLTAPLEREPRVHLLLLVYNRIKYVEEALRQLAAANYGNYAVYILDNGSTDGSAAVTARAGEFFPASVPVHSLVMPFNTGRPLGHNWLLTHFDHSEAEYIAIGDDDLVQVPPDWMRNMVRTFNCFPGAALVGGKALDPPPGKVISSGARRLTTFDEKNGVDFLWNTELPDVGQQDYVDLVDHVIGCLHMYKKEALLDKPGLFDIRYSPCQYVDVDHHIRMRLDGLPIVYNGLIEFRHARVMGSAALTSRELLGNAAGNRHKLLHRHDPEAVQRLIARGREELAGRVARYSGDNACGAHRRVESRPLPKNVALLARNPLLPCFQLRLAQPLQWYCDAVGGTLRTGPCSREDLPWADVVVLQREPTAAMLQTVAEARELGIPVVYDMDDLLTDLPDFLVFPFTNRNAPEIIRNMITEADLTTCSTARLEREIAPLARASAVAPNAIAAPAIINVARKQREGPCTFVLAASDTVQSDWLRYPLTRILRKYPQSRLVVVGRVGKDWQSKNIAADYHPLLSPQAFSELLLSLRSAVGVIPLDDSLFSSCKSAIKFYHYSLCGVVTAASRVPPYTDEITHGESGLLLENDPQAWLTALEELAESVMTRRLLLANALCWCRDNAGPARAVEGWKQAFSLLPERNAASYQLNTEDRDTSS